MHSGKIRLIVIILGILVCLFAFIGWGYTQAKQFWGWEPYRMGIYERRGGETRLSVLSYYPVDNRAEVIVFGGESTLNASSQYGQFTAQKLVELDKQEESHGKIVKDTLTANLGMYVRGLVVSERDRGKLSEIDISWTKSMLRSQLVANRGNLVKFIDALRIYIKSLDLSKTNVIVTNLEERSVWKTQDGTFDSHLFDRLVSVNEVKPTDNILPVVIVNLTLRPGLAVTLARVLEREGYEVIRTESESKAGDNRTKSFLEISKLNENDSRFHRLKLITGINQIEKVNNQERYQAKIYLGEDFSQF